MVDMSDPVERDLDAYLRQIDMDDQEAMAIEATATELAEKLKNDEVIRYYGCKVTLIDDVLPFVDELDFTDCTTQREHDKAKADYIKRVHDKCDEVAEDHAEAYWRCACEAARREQEAEDYQTKKDWLI